MNEDDWLPGEDAQEYHDRTAAPYAPTPESREYAKRLLAVKTGTAQDVVELVMEEHNMTREQAEQALLDTGWF